MTSLERLVHMANQIALNFATEVDPAGAIALHIGLFWDRRMKQMIRGYDGPDLLPHAAAAIASLTPIGEPT
jgi:hypothetical protein